MAKIFYNLKQNKVKNSKIYGKWIAHGKTIEPLSTRRQRPLNHPHPSNQHSHYGFEGFLNRI